MDGESAENNPYEPGTLNHQRWEDGIREMPPENEVQPKAGNEDLIADDIIRARINFLKAQQEFLGIDPKKEDDNRLFVKRLVRYSAAQSAVIDAQNLLLSALGVI